MKPFIGAIVIFRNSMNVSEAAIVTGLNPDGSINTMNFHPSGHVAPHSKVQAGTGAGQWNWPDSPLVGAPKPLQPAAKIAPAIAVGSGAANTGAEAGN